jgi:hypothetical protein
MSGISFSAYMVLMEEYYLEKSKARHPELSALLDSIRFKREYFVFITPSGVTWCEVPKGSGSHDDKKM